MSSNIVPYQNQAVAQYGEPIKIVSSGRLGHAHDGTYRYVVSYTQHDRPWPGADTQYPATTFVVSREGPNGVDMSWGFHTEQEAWDFLSGYGEQEYQHWSQYGQPVSEVRERLAIPDGMIKRYQTDAATGMMDATFKVKTTERPLDAVEATAKDTSKPANKVT